MQAGTAIGPYRIETLLGVGGMGQVYRAHGGSLQAFPRYRYAVGAGGQRFLMVVDAVDTAPCRSRSC